MAISAQLKPLAGPKLISVKGHLLQLSLAWFFRQCWAVIILAVLGSLSYLLIARFGVQTVQVEGSSMSPTLTDSGHYWLNRSAYVISEPRKDDVVALKD